MGCTLVMLLRNDATCLASFGANILLLIYTKNSLETYQNAYLESELVGFVINRKFSNTIIWYLSTHK